MKNFSTLINKLESTNKTSTKVVAIVNYLQTADENDKLWLLRLFSGNRPKRPVNTTFLRQWALELSQIPEWLFIESYSSVGDLGETIALILPPPTHTISKTLSQWMDDLAMLHTMTDEQKKEFVIHSWNGLDYTERFIFNKLIGGSFRIGVSQKILITAIAKYSGREEPALMHSIMGTKNWTSITFEALIAGDTINEDNSKPYPFCLAYPLEKEIEELGAIDQWQIEYKWDGIRGQLIKRNGEVFIWSRGEELVTDSFPELKEALSSVDGDFVIDGEILVVKDNLVLNFNELQKRLNRKTISKKMMEDLPVKVFLYDMIERNGQDVRQEPLHLRREWLQSLIQNNAHPSLHISPIIQANSWEEVAQLRADSRHNNSEGLMLKMRDSVYHSGRKKGDWWKWKVNPLTIDAVLIYAQKGSGRRSAYYTDYTFAVRQGDELVTIAKAYSGLTDKEIMEVSKFVNKNAIEKFGPVRTVKPELVFEIAFEGINFSNRHKSGVALRFPRILRWRQDKTVADIDDIESVKALIQ